MPVNGKSRRSYQGAPVSNTLNTTLAVGGTSISLAAAMSGWSTDGVPFFVVVEPGTAREEKICVKYNTSTSLTVVNPADTSVWSANAAGRGADNTTNQSHAIGSVIYPVFTATEANHANELVSKYANAGSVVYQGSGSPGTFTELAVGTAAQVLKVNAGATAPEWGQVATAGIADSAVTSAKIADGTIVAGDIAADAITTAKIADGAITAAKLDAAVLGGGTVPLDNSVTSAKIVNNTIVLADLATSLQAFLVPVGTINAYAGATAPTGWLLCNGTSTTGYTTLAALVGATTPDMRGKFPMGKTASGTGSTLLGTGGSTTIATTNLPSHSHANTAVLTSGTVTITDPGHDHVQSTEFALVYNASDTDRLIVNQSSTAVNPTLTGSRTTGITASVGTAITMTNASTGSGTDYFQPFIAVNYIIKHD